MTSTVHANHPKPRPDVVVRLPGGPPLLVPAIAVLTVAAVAVSIHTAEPTPSPRRSASTRWPPSPSWQSPSPATDSLCFQAPAR